APYRSTDVIANTKGIDVVLDGHSHSVIKSDEVDNAEGKKVLLSQTGTKLESIGKLVIKADGSLSTELVKEYTKKDEATATFIGKIQEDLQTVLNTVVAKSDVELSINAEDGTRAVRNRETAIGDFCADAYRYVSGADIAFVNGGGVRATIAKGEVTYEDIINVHPYGNEMCVIEVTGQEIIDALELGSKNILAETVTKAEDGTLNAAGESGGFLQVSGLEYIIDPAINSSVVVDENGLFVKVDGERRVKEVKVLNKETGKYEAIDLNKTYTLAAHNYMIKSMGDGFSMFADNALIQDSVMLDNQVLITYIKDNLKGVIGEDYASPEGRITVLGANEAKKAA
ncbi:MAG: bifunctional metallophosphatase/5'-nucleotidase, partial [Cellulosilyticum sp.]|nr:bifunctional metallophosphatase/5'-nucleotidase [Cellulosilyticum sp.]